MGKFESTMFVYMVVSCVSVSAGAIILRLYSMVPVALSYITGIAIFALSITAYFVLKGNRIALNLGVLLAVLAALTSASSPSHLAYMTEIFHGGLITILDILEIIGFYLFPAIYIISWVRHRAVEKGDQTGDAA